jgi:hypothetical protein
MQFLQIQNIILDTYLVQISRKSWHEGGVAAEQNHSSVAAYLGDGAVWTVLENIAQLLRRHQDSFRRHMVAEDNLYLLIHVYKTIYQGYKGLSDMEQAKKSLSANAYKWFL